MKNYQCVLEWSILFSITIEDSIEDTCYEIPNNLDLVRLGKIKIVMCFILT